MKKLDFSLNQKDLIICSIAFIAATGISRIYPEIPQLVICLIAAIIVWVLEIAPD